MNKLKKILKVLRDMFKDGITHLLVFVGLIIVSTVFVILIFVPAIICILVFGKEIGGNIALIIYSGLILLALAYDFIDKFRRRMSMYE